MVVASDCRVNMTNTSWSDQLKVSQRREMGYANSQKASGKGSKNFCRCFKKEFCYVRKKRSRSTWNNLVGMEGYPGFCFLKVTLSNIWVHCHLIIFYKTKLKLPFDLFFPYSVPETQKYKYPMKMKYWVTEITDLTSLALGHAGSRRSYIRPRRKSHCWGNMCCLNSVPFLLWLPKPGGPLWPFCCPQK